MATTGVLEAMARADLAILTRELSEEYSAGSLETLSDLDPGWRAALDRAEREVGVLYERLCEADAVLERWRHALRDLERLWLSSRRAELLGGVRLDAVA